MMTIKTKQEEENDRINHSGMNEYRIFYKLPDGTRKTVRTFWANSGIAAQKQLESFKLDMKIIDPNDDHEYFYSTVGEYVEILPDGSYAHFDSMKEMFAYDYEQHSQLYLIYDKICAFFTRIWHKIENVWYMFKDFAFYVKTYAKGNPHSRKESWALDEHMIKDLEYNLPIIIKNKHGVPNEFCMLARVKMNENVKNFDINASFKANPNSSNAELEYADNLFKEKMNEFMLHIRLYRYYNDYGIGEEYADLIEKYPVPYVSGTDKQTDYVKITDLVDKEWNAIWEFMRKYGHMLWD